MANAKISDDSVFVPETSDVRNITGLAGYTGSGNVKITGSLLAQSVVNESLSGIGTNNAGNINSRVAFYGVGNPSNTLAGAEGFQYYSANSSQSTSASLQLGVPGGNQYDVGNLILNGNYIAGNEQPKFIFKFGDTTNTPKEFTITTSSSGVDQTLILPSALPSTGQYLKASGVFNTNNVTLGWDSPITGSGTNLKLPIFNGTGELGDSAIFQDSTGADPKITLFSSDVQIKKYISHQENPEDTFIGFTDEGKFEVTTDNTQAILCGTSGEVELKKTGVTVAQTIDHALALTGNGTQFAGRTRYWDYDNDRYVDIIGPNNSGAVSYGLILPNTPLGDGTTPANKILESDTNGALSWINTPASFSPGGNNQSVQYQTSTGVFGGDSGFTYQFQVPTVGDTRNRLSLGDVGSTKGEVNLYGGATESGFIGLFAPTDEGVTITVPTAPNDSYTVTLPGDTPANNQILESNSSGNLSWIDTPTGGGIDFSGVNVSTPADITQSTQNQYGSAVTVTAAANISNGEIVIWDYSNGTVRANIPGSLPGQSEIIGVAIEDINSGSTGKVLIYGYATVSGAYSVSGDFLNETNTINFPTGTNVTTTATLPTGADEYITLFDSGGSGTGDAGNNQVSSVVLDAGAGNTVIMKMISFDFERNSSFQWRLRDRLEVLVGSTANSVTPAQLQGVTGTSSTSNFNGFLQPNTSFLGSSLVAGGPYASGNIFPDEPGRTSGGQTGPQVNDVIDLGQRFAQFNFVSDGAPQSDFELQITSSQSQTITNTTPGAGIYLDSTNFEQATNNTSTARYIGAATGSTFANNRFVVFVAPPRV